MASVCISQTNYQQQHQQQQHRLQFQLLNNDIMLLQPQQNQQYRSAKNQPIAPAPTKVLSSSNMHNIHASTGAAAAMRMGVGPIVPKKKYTYTNMPYGQQLPSVARRNARERNRVKQVNNGFTNLRQHLPQSVVNTLSHGGRGASKKLSKVDTLRIAVEYIRGLQDLLEDAGVGKTVHGDDFSNDGSSFSFSTADMHYQKSHSYHSEASASPTPSYSDSEISIGGSNYLQPIKMDTPQQQHQPREDQFKFESFEEYSPLDSDEQPDDEELLDYISSWQEQ